jgi:hypothetical protein
MDSDEESDSDDSLSPESLVRHAQLDLTPSKTPRDAQSDLTLDFSAFQLQEKSSPTPASRRLTPRTIELNSDIEDEEGEEDESSMGDSDKENAEMVSTPANGGDRLESQVLSSLISVGLDVTEDATSETDQEDGKRSLPY